MSTKWHSFLAQSDEAWNYYAGAAEMAALAQFLQNDPLKKYPGELNLKFRRVKG
jgi:hypothetical protein